MRPVRGRSGYLYFLCRQKVPKVLVLRYGAGGNFVVLLSPNKRIKRGFRSVSPYGEEEGGCTFCVDKKYQKATRGGRLWLAPLWSWPPRGSPIDELLHRFCRSGWPALPARRAPRRAGWRATRKEAAPTERVYFRGPRRNPARGPRKTRRFCGVEAKRFRWGFPSCPRRRTFTCLLPQEQSV